MVRMWFTGRFLEEECDYLNKCPNKRGYEGCMGGTLVGSGLDFIPKLIQMGFYGGVIVDVNAWDFAFNAVVGVDQPESGPVVGVALDVAASQNWPNDRLRSLALFLGLTV